jgi:hypothetical protein
MQLTSYNQNDYINFKKHAQNCIRQQDGQWPARGAAMLRWVLGAIKSLANFGKSAILLKSVEKSLVRKKLVILQFARSQRQLLGIRNFWGSHRGSTGSPRDPPETPQKWGGPPYQRLFKSRSGPHWLVPDALVVQERLANLLQVGARFFTFWHPLFPLFGGSAGVPRALFFGSAGSRATFRQIGGPHPKNGDFSKSRKKVIRTTDRGQEQKNRTFSVHPPLLAKNRGFPEKYPPDPRKPKK